VSGRIARTPTGHSAGAGSGDGAEIEHRIDLDRPPAEALAAVAKAAEAWGADWQPGIDGGRLGLPLVAGIRHGLVQGRLEVERHGAGSRLAYRPEDAVFVVRTAPVAILAIAGAGGVMTVLWPFFPALLPLAPLGAILALSGWFLVVSRLSTSTPDDFLRLVAEVAGEEGADGAAAEERGM
jgi:hypothetical protein